jgi:RDD family
MTLSNDDQLQHLPKRATAALIDMVVVGLLCFGLEWAVRIAEPPRRHGAFSCGVLLALLILVEMLTGWTIGKIFARLSIRRGDGSRAPIYSLVIRAIARDLPIAIFIASLCVADDMLSLVLWGISLSVVCLYIAAAYLVLVRIGRTPFDSAAGTVVTWTS